MTTYTYKMPWGERLTISADLVQASAPIRVVCDDDDAEDGVRYVSTPYQTADACHRESKMLALVVRYLGAEWYANPNSDESHEAQLATAIKGAKLISQHE